METNSISSKPRAYTVSDIAEILNISKSAAYKFVRQPGLGFKVLRLGTAVRIPRESFDAWLAS